MVDQLAVAASTLQPSQELLDGDGKLEINFRPSIPDNMEHWQVFQDDQQILRCIHNVKEFSNFNLNHQEWGKEYRDEGDQLRNLVSRVLVTLEHIFDIHDGRKNNID